MWCEYCWIGFVEEGVVVEQQLCIVVVQDVVDFYFFYLCIDWYENCVDGMDCECCDDLLWQVWCLDCDVVVGIDVVCEQCVGCIDVCGVEFCVGQLVVF